MAAPTRINYRKSSRTLALTYPDQAFELPAELLRVFSPSAEVRGHGDADRTLQTGKKYVHISGIESVGNYAIRITFDDGHDTGLFTWDYLHELGQTYSQKWPAYEANLASLGLSRDRG